MKKRDKNSLIHIENCQIKSLEKAQLLASLLDQLEKEFGIREVIISFKNNFGNYILIDHNVWCLAKAGIRITKV